MCFASISKLSLLQNRYTMNLIFSLFLSNDIFCQRKRHNTQKLVRRLFPNIPRSYGGKQSLTAACSLSYTGKKERHSNQDRKF